MALILTPIAETTNNTLAVVDGVGNRYIGYSIHPNESNAQRDLTDVTLGGVSAAAVLVNEPISGNQLSVFYAYFLEAQIAARVSDVFVPVWAAAPPSVKVYAFQVDGEVDQLAPHNGAAQVVSNPGGPIAPVDLPSVSVLDGGLAFEFAASGTGGTTFTWVDFTQLSTNGAGGFTTATAMQAVPAAASITAEYSATANRSSLMLLSISEAGDTNPSVSNVASGAGDISPGDVSVPIDGTNFEALQGTGIVTFSPTDDITDVLRVEVSTVTAWAATQVSVTIPDPLSLLYDNIFVFVTNNTGDSNANGFQIALTPKVGVAYTRIAFQHPDGILAGVAGVELGVDQIEYSTTTPGGGTVVLGPSGTYEVFGYVGAPVSQDTFTYRLGDQTDQTWSAETTFTIGAETGTGTADTTSNSDIVAAGQKDTSSDASHSSTSTLAVGAQKDTSGAANTTSNSNIAAVGSKAGSEAANTTSNSDIVAAGTKAGNSAVDTTSNSDIVAAGTKAGNSAVNLTSNSTITAIGTSSTAATGTADTTSNSDIVAAGTKDTSSDVSHSSTSDINAAADKDTTGAADTLSNSDIVADGTKDTSSDAGHSSLSDITVVSDRANDGVVDATSNSDINAQGDKASNSDAGHSSTSDIIADGQKDTSSIADHSSVSSITVIGVASTPGGGSANTLSNSDIVAAGTKDVPGAVDASSQSDVVAIGARSSSGVSDTSSLSNITATGQKGASSAADLASQSDLQATGEGVLPDEGVANTSSLSTVTAIGRKSSTGAANHSSVSSITAIGLKNASSAADLSSVSNITILSGSQVLPDIDPDLIMLESLTMPVQIESVPSTQLLRG